MGCSILRAARISARKHKIIGLNLDAFRSGIFDCDSAYITPPLSNITAFRERLLEIVVKEKPDLILAGRDDDVPVLAQMSAELAELGSVVAASSESAVNLCRDKLATAQFFEKAGLPFARTAHERSGISLLVKEEGFPVVVKPRSGSGSHGVSIAFDHTDLSSALEGPGDVIVQKYLKPKNWPDQLQHSDVYLPSGKIRQEMELSIQVILGPNGVLGPFASENSLQGYMPVGVRVIESLALQEIVRKASEKFIEARLTGPCNFQARETAPETFQFFEVNPRCTGITDIRASIGFNEIDLILDALVHKNDVVSPKFPTNQLAYRYWSHVVFQSADLEELQSRGEWRPSS